MIGVNFGGYHAEAGLGGLLTGNAAHGGLIASAGTPSGQSAVAGLGGNSGRKLILDSENFTTANMCSMYFIINGNAHLFRS